MEWLSRLKGQTRKPVLQNVVLEHGTVRNTHKKRGMTLKRLKKRINNLDLPVLKNKAWPAEVLKQLPLWFEDQVRKNRSQEEIAQNFHGTFTQKRTFHAIEAKV
jgi:hypothetical protein